MNDETNPKNREEKTDKPWYFQPRSIAIAFVSVVFLILIFQNKELVRVKVLFFQEFSAPAALLYFFFAVSGFIAARLTMRPKPKG